MVYWIVFHLTIIILLIGYRSAKNIKKKNIYSYIIIVVLVFFSGYRDGLGTDWENYIQALSSRSTFDSLILGVSEPLFNAIAFFISNTIFSPIFFFLLTAFVTNVGIGKFLFEDPRYAVFAVLIYVFLPTLYGMTFNIVRQYFAVGLFFYSMKYIGVSFPKYLFVILLASLMHMSAIILIPFYWILQVRIRRKAIILLYLVPAMTLPFLMTFLSTMGLKYSDEAYSDSVLSSYGMILIYNLFFLLFVFNKTIYCGLNNRNRNLFILFVVVIDMSFLNYFFYRLSYYFFPVVTMIFPYILFKLKKNPSIIIIFIMFLSIMNYHGLLSNVNEKALVPDKILPIMSIVDDYYIEK